MEEKLTELKKRLEEITQKLELEGKRKTLRSLSAKAAKPDFWQNQDEARHTLQEIAQLQEEIEAVEKLKRALGELEEISSQTDKQKETQRKAEEIKKELDSLELATFLSGPYDRENAIVSIHAGQGGTEAMDWAQMLLRMYLKFAQRRGWEIEIVDQTLGEQAGIKSATMLVKGLYVYGYLKGEAGTHRLVRQSPFNADRLRQTSFALVEVLPQLPPAKEVEIADEDLQWQFFRASTQGGQNVQKVSTAVRLTHKPTGIVATSQAQRYQEQNRKIALDLLRAKLWARGQREREKKVKSLKGEYRPASWGNQIRSYVLHPYKMIKDLRTEVETSDTEAVLDGEIDEFVQAESRLLTS